MDEISVIPSIIATTFEELEASVKRLEPHVERVHLDIMDGIFVKGKTIEGFRELAKLNTNLKFDVHLMVQDPYSQMFEWYQVGPADRFCIHVECRTGLDILLEQVKLNNRSIGIVINPETRSDELSPYLEAVDFVQFMTVQPGQYGAPFIQATVGKINAFKEENFEMPIAVDGSINPQTAKDVVRAGASILVCGSYIKNSPDVAKAIEEIKAL